MNKAEERLKKAYGHFTEKEFELALEECGDAIFLDDSIADAHNLRGVLLEELDRAADALSAYERAVEIEPGFQEAKENLLTLREEFRKRDKIVTAAVFNFLYEAEAARAELSALGIWSIIADGEAAGVMPHVSIALDGVKLKVKPEDLQRVRKALGGQSPAEGKEDEFLQES
jgi:tetratricopeptide (TPR) repeat protein